MREVKFRLINHNIILGFEKWYIGKLDSQGWHEAFPAWLYSKDGEHWNPQTIPHNGKDEFTGLKDKNGKEIYEGDIVRWNDGELAEVSFGYRGISAGSALPMGSMIEVVGNVYENSSLLTK